VWLAVPAKRPLAESTLPMWREPGYRVAVFLDEDPKADWPVDYFVVGRRGYPGYAQAVNILVDRILMHDPECQWIVTGGDDILPDPTHSPEEIAAQCVNHFEGMHQAGMLAGKPFPTHLREQEVGTWGVMQPTGDSWGDRTGPYIERVCGSPWLGREFCLRINQGHGPLWPQYFHMGSDEELQAVSTRLGVLWQRPDLTHYHRHWGRARKNADDMPDFLKRANSGAEWAAYKKLFAERQAAGFPGSEPL